MREQKMQYNLIRRNYTYTGLNELEVFGFEYFLINLLLKVKLSKTFERKYLISPCKLAHHRIKCAKNDTGKF
jgi:hypothetical protein